MLHAVDATSEAVTSTPVKVTTDRYGFVISNAGTPGASTSASDNSPAMNKESARVKKWQKMLGQVMPVQVLQPFSGAVVVTHNCFFSPDHV